VLFHIGMNMRINLYDLPCVEFDRDEKVLYVDDRPSKPNVRLLRDLKEVLYNKDLMGNGNLDSPLYFMYRDVKREEDSEIFDVAQLRFDITIMEPIHLGFERNKTLGHYHKIGQTGFSYPEVYEVIQGEADYILQQVQEGRVIEVVLVQAKEGDIVYIPSGYWHVTINAGNGLLVMSNLVSKYVEGEYEPVKKYGGIAYFELVDGSLVVNKNYGDVPPIRRINARQTFKRLTEGKLYPQFINDYTNFQFLDRIGPKTWQV